MSHISYTRGISITSNPLITFTNIISFRLFTRSMTLPDQVLVNSVAMGLIINKPATAAGEPVIFNTDTFNAIKYIHPPKYEMPMPDNNNAGYFHK